MLNIKTVKNNLRCGRFSKLENVETNSKKGLGYKNAIAIREAIRNRKADENYIDSILDDDLFPLKETKDAIVKSLSAYVQRYLDYLQTQNIIAEDVYTRFDYAGKKVSMKIDFIIEHDNVVEFVLFRTRKNNLSYRARIEENMPSKNVDLYFLYQAALNLPEYNPNNKEIVVSKHFLRKSGKNKKYLPSQNIISVKDTVFDDEFEDEIKNAIKEKETNDMNINRKCDSCKYKLICEYSLSRSENNIQMEVKEEDVELDKAPKDFKLTENQRKIIAFNKGIARVNAGAGTGKTTTIALRIVELVLAGYDPKDFLLITFTNKGAAEMREKIEYWLNKEGLSDVDVEEFNIMTFNSWGEKIVKENYKELGFKEEPILADTVILYDTIIKTLKNFPQLSQFNYKYPLLRFRYSIGVVPELAKIFETIQAYMLVSPDRLREEIKGENGLLEKYYKLTDEEIDILYEMFVFFKEELTNQNVIEYQDQINLVISLINNKPEKLSKYNYAHIIVDEFQDSDVQQLDMIQFLINQPKFTSLMVVGDDSQSIFGFRNTSQEIIINFHKIFPETIDLKMVENHRSTANILRLANDVNSINKIKIDKDLVSGREEGELPKLTVFDRQKEEHEYIVKKIAEDINNGIKPSDIAVLGRTKLELRKISELLNQANIPNKVDITEPVIENKNLRLIKDFTKYINNREYTDELLKFLYIKDKGFKDLSSQEMKFYLDNANYLIEKEITNNFFSEFDKNGETDKNEIYNINKRKFNIFFRIFDFFKDDEEVLAFKDVLKEKKFKKFSELSEYLNKMYLYEDFQSVEVEETKNNIITLTTAHSSKGREWRKVYLSLTKFLDSQLVKATNRYNDKEVEEERRLVFVAITRAKEMLHLTSEKTYKHRDSRYLRPFIGELMDFNLVYKDLTKDF